MERYIGNPPSSFRRDDPALLYYTRPYDDPRSPNWPPSYDRYGWSAHHATDRYRAPPPEELRASRAYRKSPSPLPHRSYTPVTMKKTHSHRRKSRSPRYSPPPPPPREADWLSGDRRVSRSPMFRSRSPILRSYEPPPLSRRSRSPISHRKSRLPPEPVKLSPKRHVSRRKTRSPSYDKTPIVSKKHLKRSPLMSESSNSPEDIHGDESNSRHSYSSRVSNKSDKKRHAIKIKKAQKRPHSKSHKKKKRKKKIRSTSPSLSPAPILSDESPPSPPPTTIPPQQFKKV